MALIETEEAAGRLARVIASDIELYNRQKIQQGADLTAEVEEGYRLFRSRVAPSLLPVFESVLIDKGLLAGGKTPAPVAPPQPVRRPTPAVATARSEASPVPAPREDPPTEPVAAPSPVAARPAPAVYGSPPVEPAPSEPLPPNEEPSATEERPTLEGARRLARVIISDIQIYNPKKIAAGEDLTREIDEGRALFKARMGDNLMPLFEAMLVEKGLAKAPQAAEPAPAPTPSWAAAPARLASPPRGLTRAPSPALGVAPPSASEPEIDEDAGAEVDEETQPVAPQPVAARPRVSTPPAMAAAEPPRRATPFPLDEPTQAIDDPFAYEAAPRRTQTPVSPDAAAAALSRMDTPIPGMKAAPLRTPTPFLDDLMPRTSGTPGPTRRGLPPPIPVAARTLKPVPLPVGASTPTPSPLSQVTPAPLAAGTPAPAPLPLPGRMPMAGAPDAAPIAVTTSHRRKPPIRLAAAGAAIVAALGLAYLLFSL